MIAAKYPVEKMKYYLSPPHVIRYTETMHDPDHHRTIAKLIETIGQEDCLRCGLLIRDDNETLHLTALGTGYLVEVEAAEIKTLHEAYAAGFRSGVDMATD